jgi:hypothetical protein
MIGNLAPARPGTTRLLTARDCGTGTPGRCGILTCLTPDAGCPSLDAEPASFHTKVDEAVRRVNTSALLFGEPWLTFGTGIPSSPGGRAGGARAPRFLGTGVWSGNRPAAAEAEGDQR